MKQQDILKIYETPDEIHTNAVVLTRMININFNWEKLEGNGNVMN